MVFERRTSAGKFILPQPKTAAETGEYVPIPILSRYRKVPFGYELKEGDRYLFHPIPSELEALEKAKDYLKRYSSRHVAAWLTKVTGRSISHVGLLKRIRDEYDKRAKAGALRGWAARIEKAIELAAKYEKTKGCKQKPVEETSDTD
jgi:hypothetical protein